MAIRNLRLEGDEILNKKSREVEVIDDKLQILIDDMIETNCFNKSSYFKNKRRT